METMSYLEILETSLIVKVFVKLQNKNQSTVTSLAQSKKIAKVIQIER